MTNTMKATLAKTARIMLVFALVFWSSFRVEAFAYAALSKDAQGMGVEDVAEGMQLTDLVIYEVDPAPKDGNTTGLGKKLASASDDGEVEVALSFDAPGESRQIVAIPKWADGGVGIDEKTGEIQIANFVTWDAKGDAAAIKPAEKNPGIATLESASAGTVTVTCGLDKDAQKKIDLEKFPTDADGAFEKAAFKVEIAEGQVEVSRRVSELRISDADGALVTGTGVPLVLPKSQVGKSYQFQTEIKLRVLTGDVESFEPLDDGYYTLADASKAGVNVTWSLTAGGDIATISQDGALTFDEEGAVEVHVEATVDEAVTPADFTVKTEGAADPSSGDGPASDDEPGSDLVPVTQGESNPQDTLTVVSNGLVAPSADDDDDAGAASDEESNGSASSSSSSSEADGQSSSSSSSSDSQQGEDEQLREIEKVYSASDLEALGMGRQSYTMYDGSDFVTVTGEGPYLAALLHDIGIDNTDQIESLTFENADGASTTIAWSELESANRYYPKAFERNYEEAEAVSPMIALSSLVRGLGDGTGEGADAASGDAAEAPDGDGDGETEPPSPSPSESGVSSSSSASSETADGSSVELLDNTRFRLLFGSTSPAREIAAPDALRYINKISVNVKPSSEEPEDPGFETDISVSVEYVPVPMGAPAVFSALPNTAIRDARFDFNWEVSTDDGKTWKEVENGNVQVLRVITSEERIGNKYRVVMSTDASDKNGRENVIVTSDPVTMTEGNGLAVVLEYDPPIAGQTAYFQTTLYGAKKGVDIKYTWQQSQDGGATWSDIAGRTGSSLAVPTEPIDPNAEKADEDEVVPITYVRVIAEESSGEKRVAISEAVPLTVHVGDDDSGPADTPKPEGENENKPSTTTDTPKQRKPQRVTPVEDITIEYPEDRDMVPTAPTADGTLAEQVDPSQLYINDEVTDIVNEQQEAVEEYVESTVPGARWTSLSSAQATDDDVRNILADNPFAPFVFPVGLGITVAGGVEKFLAFRRQVKGDSSLDA